MTRFTARGDVDANPFATEMTFNYRSPSLLRGPSSPRLLHMITVINGDENAEAALAPLCTVRPTQERRAWQSAIKWSYARMSSRGAVVAAHSSVMRTGQLHMQTREEIPGEGLCQAQTQAQGEHGRYTTSERAAPENHES